VTGAKLLAFILTRDASQTLCHLYPEATLELLTAQLASYFGTYQSDKNAWTAGLPAALARFSSLLEIEALAKQISQFAPKADQLILVPHRFLHLLPLYCLPFGKPSGSLHCRINSPVVCALPPACRCCRWCGNASRRPWKACLPCRTSRKIYSTGACCT
jgi:hypothetical protein